VLRNFGWVLPGRLAGMAYPRDGAWEELLALGVRAVLSLTEHAPEPAADTAGLSGRHEPVADFAAPSAGALERAVAFVRGHLDAGRAVVVHCHAGIGRTGTVLAATLVSLGRSADLAIDEVRRARPGSLETASQEDAVRAYGRRLAAVRALPPDAADAEGSR
jgi:atypical dual specificity phosphatase